MPGSILILYAQVLLLALQHPTKKIEATKTFVGTPNRSRFVGDVVGDDFMHSGSPTDAKQVPRASRRGLKSPRCLHTPIEQPSSTGRPPGGIAVNDSQNCSQTGHVSLLSGRVEEAA